MSRQPNIWGASYAVVVRTILSLSHTFAQHRLDGATVQRFLIDLMPYLADAAHLLLTLWVMMATKLHGGIASSRL